MRLITLLSSRVLIIQIAFVVTECGELVMSVYLDAQDVESARLGGTRGLAPIIRWPPIFILNRVRIDQDRAIYVFLHLVLLVRGRWIGVRVLLTRHHAGQLAVKVRHA